jgi:glycosyltransferase involved in cell wall biosynthesis
MLSDTAGIKHTLLKYFWFTLPLKKCALVTVISKATKDELMKFTNYPENRIHVVPVAISPDFTYAPKKFSNRPVILQVGTTINKNLDRLVQALKGIDCHVNFIGSLPDSVKASLNENNISFSNATDISHAALVEQYRLCDMISFVSTYEGFGMPIVEANAVGRPVVTSNILSMPEVAGNAACLVDPFDVADIRRGIMQVISNETYRSQLIKNGLENRKRFDPQAIADQYLALYLQLSRRQKN